MRSALDKSSPPLVNQDVRDDGGARGPVPAPAGVVAGGQGFEFGLAFRGGQQGLQFLLPLREGNRRFNAVRLSEESGPAVQEGLDGFGVCAPVQDNAVHARGRRFGRVRGDAVLTQVGRQGGGKWRGNLDGATLADGGHRQSGKGLGHDRVPWRATRAS